MRRYLFIFLYITLFFIQKIKAQDPVYSQFYYNRLELNPAFAGNDGGGKFRINSFHRNLYRPIKGPFNSTNFSLDYGLCNTNLGFGLLASNENQGDGFLQTNKIEGVLSGVIPFRRNGYFNWGFKYGYIFQNLDWTKYTFSDQYDPIYGMVRSSINSNLASDFSSSANWSSGLNVTGWNWKKTFAYNFGIVGNNLFSPSIGYLSPYRLPQRFTLYGGFTFHKNPAINASSGRLFFRVDKQYNYFTNIILGEYYFNNTLNIGLGCRLSIYNSALFNNTSSIILSAGLQPHPTLKIIGSFESNLGGLNLIGAGNTFELGIVWVPEQEICSTNGFFNSFRSKRKGGRGGAKRINCPVFGKDVIRQF